MSDELAFVRQIQDSGAAFVLAVTGGGSLAIGRLLSVPGASRSVLEAAVPYSAAALRDFLQCSPEQYCEPATARLMAMAAFGRARAYAQADAIEKRLFGVGCTASLASDRPKRGAHRVHVAWQSDEATVTYSLELEKDARSRIEEEAIAADLALNAIADAAGIVERLPLSLRGVEQVAERRTHAPSAWRKLVFDHGAPVGTRPSVSDAPVLFPGAFHPLHDGHRGMAEVVFRKLGRPLSYELSVQNVDKPSLDYTEIEDRLAQFRADEGIWLTAAPTFVEKARLFPGATFIVGLDTIVRIGEVRYYRGSFVERDAAIEEIAKLGCRFMVFGRKCGEPFQSLQNVALPESLARLCSGVSEQEFRVDVSSTELRRRG